MKITITKDTIILIGLLYNYLTNIELEIHEWRIKSFIDSIKNKIVNDNIAIEITDEYIEKQNDEINKYLEKDENKKVYKLINICNIDSWYKRLPRELIDLTLKNDILPTIYSENLKLIVPIKKEYIPCEETKIIIANDEYSAKNYLIDSLNKDNSKNIQIESIIKTDNENQSEYSITYKCDKYLETIDMQQILAKRIKKKKEVLELLFEKRRNLTNLNDINSNEYKEIELAIEKVKSQLYGKIINKKQPEQVKKENNVSKELIDLASKCSSIFEINSIEVSQELSEKLIPLGEISYIKTTIVLSEPQKTTKKNKKIKKK